MVEHWHPIKKQMKFGEAVSYIADTYGWNVFPLTEHELPVVTKKAIEARNVILQGTRIKTDFWSESTEEIQERLARASSLKNVAKHYDVTVAKLKEMLEKRNLSWKERAKEVVSVVELSSLLRRGYTMREIAVANKVYVSSIADLSASHRLHGEMGEPVTNFEERKNMVDDGRLIEEIALKSGMLPQDVKKEFAQKNVKWDAKVSRNGLKKMLESGADIQMMMKYFKCGYTRIRSQVLNYGYDYSEFRKNSLNYIKANCQSINAVSYQLAITHAQVKELFPELEAFYKKKKGEKECNSH